MVWAAVSTNRKSARYFDGIGQSHRHRPARVAEPDYDHRRGALAEQVC
jgi:hypothetical protein